MFYLSGVLFLPIFFLVLVNPFAFAVCVFFTVDLKMRNAQLLLGYGCDCANQHSTRCGAFYTNLKIVFAFIWTEYAEYAIGRCARNASALLHRYHNEKWETCALNIHGHRASLTTITHNRVCNKFSRGMFSLPPDHCTLPHILADYIPISWQKLLTRGFKVIKILIWFRISHRAVYQCVRTCVWHTDGGTGIGEKYTFETMANVNNENLLKIVKTRALHQAQSMWLMHSDTIACRSFDILYAWTLFAPLSHN